MTSLVVKKISSCREKVEMVKLLISVREGAVGKRKIPVAEKK